MAKASDSSSIRYFGAADRFGLRQIGEVWEARELLMRFFQRDLLIRYRQVAVGVIWVLLQPLLGTLIFMGLFFLLGTKAGSDSTPYAITALIGMLCWQLVSSSFRDATGALVNYRHVITKIYFPRLLLPLAGLLCGVFDFLVGSLLILPMLWWTQASIQWSTLWLCIPIFLWLLLFCIGCIAWLSSLNALYRDVGYALPFMLQIVMFVSPVVYDVQRIESSLGTTWRVWYEANPVAGCIIAFRWALVGSQPPTVLGVLLSLMVTMLLLFSGLAWFRHADQQLADRI